MIKRNAARYTKNQESLQQSSFTAMRGIDSSKAPTQPDTILNAVNLDVDYDGGLVLRKPLLFKKSHGEPIGVFTIFDKATKLVLYKNSIEIHDINSHNQSISNYVFTDIYGIKHTKNSFTISLCNFENCEITNTSNTTLLSNVSVLLDNVKDDTGVEVYNSFVDPMQQVRVCKIYKENDDWCFEMLTPEINVVTSDDIAVDFNTSLPNPYAIRDDYNASTLSLKGILAYRRTSLGRDGAREIFTPSALETETRTLIPYKVVGFSEGLDIKTVIDGEYLTSIQISTKFTDMFKSVHIWIYRSADNGLLGEYSVSVNNVTPVFVKDIDLSSYKYSNVKLEVYYTYEGIPKADYIDTLTESTLWEMSNTGFDNVPGNIFILKAFMSLPDKITFNPTDEKQVLIKWESSTDGVNWNNHTPTDRRIPVGIPEKLNTDLESDSSVVWREDYYQALEMPSFKDRASSSIIHRADCFKAILEDTNKAYRCTLIYAKTPAEGSNAPTSYVVDFEIGQRTFYFRRSTFTAYASELKNPNIGNITYWKHALYSISPSFKNLVYASNPDSAIFPISRIIDLGTFEGNTVRKLIPWRDYLIAFTDSTVHLIQEQEVGFTSKVINTFVGTPERDANTCVATLNGIVFKSGSKMYSIVPNVNSGDETIFNVSEISKPIEHILERLEYNDTYNPFAFTTAEAYYLFVPGKVDTFCLKYNYTMRVWTQFKYPVLLYKHEMLSVDDIRVFAKDDSEIIEYEFEKEPSDTYELQTYGDFLTTDKDLNDKDDPDDDTYRIEPIEFFVDSGQKCDNLHLTKQFVESKIIVATLSNKDNFEMDVQIAVEGNMFNKHIDVNTDGALLRGDSNQVLTLGTTTDLSNDEDVFNTMRQIFIRYSGRGKTVRHIIKGKSLYKFKIYETFYRYKILNVKQ